VLRAYAYFLLVRLFGPVPLITQQIKSLNQSNLIFASQSPIDSVYNQIISDLQFGIQNLPPTRSGVDIGRVTSGVAIALLGKVYLTMAGNPLKLSGYYQKAVQELQQIVGPANESKYGYQLLNDYSSIFSNDNKRNPEILLSFSQFYNNVSTNGSIFPFFLMPQGYADKDEQTLYAYTKNFYNLYEPADIRRDVTLITKYSDLRTGDSVFYDFSRNSYVDTVTHKIVGIPGAGICLGKYDRAARPAGSPPWGHSDDQIHIRFSDVILMLAEADNEIGNTSDALSLLNRIRARAHASLYSTTNQDSLRLYIRKERRLELCGEFTTTLDIRRWGTLQQEIDSMSNDQILNHDLQPYDPKFELYPIPQGEIYANPNLKQNPGW